MRKIFRGFDEIIKIEHLEALGKLIILTGTIVTYSYAIEFFIAYYSGNPYERAIFWFRPFGELKGFFWLMVLCNCIGPLPLWRKENSFTNLAALFVISNYSNNIGMWLERFNIVVNLR